MRKLLLIVVMLLVARNLAYAGNEANRYAEFQEQQRQVIEEARKAEQKIKSSADKMAADTKQAIEPSKDSEAKRILDDLLKRNPFSADTMLTDAKLAIGLSNDSEAKRILDDLLKRHPKSKEIKEATLLLKIVDERITAVEQKRKKGEEEERVTELATKNIPEV